VAAIELAQSLPRFDVRCYAGRPLTIRVPVLDGNGDLVEVGVITSARAQVRAGIDSDQVLHTFGIDDDPPDLAIVDGWLVLTATSAVTTSWALLWPGRAPATTAWWDIEVTDVEDEPWQISEPGEFVVVHQVTR
jgi:hypothetical protein